MAAPAGWIDLGAVGYTDKGNYNPTTTYNKFNVVKYKGSSWVCNLDNTIGKEPTEGIYWHTMMEGVAVATTEKTGTVMPDGKTILVDKDGKVSVPTATETAFGLVKPDGETITIKDGVLSGQSKVAIATTDTVGTVKPDGTTIKIADDGTISAESTDLTGYATTEALAKKGDALAYDSKTGELTLKSGDTGLSTVTIKSGSGEISLVITFSEEFKGLEYTIAGGSESYTDTVPSSLIATHTVEALETIYTITAMYEGTEYTTTVRTGDYYGHYFGSLTAWKAYIEATVTDAISGPVVGADVTAKSNTKSYHATTDSTGKATIQIGKAGTYTVSALNTGGETSDSTSVTVSTEGETYTVALSYFKATLTVKVINGNGATVTATDGAGHTYTGTATSGSVAMTVHAAGTYTVSSKLNGTAGYTTKKVEITTNGGSYSAAVLQSGATFSAGSDEVIGAMIDAAQDGDLDLKTLWAVGDTRTISVAAFAGVQNQHATQSIDIVITSFEDYNNAGAVMQFDMKDCLAEYEYMNSSNTGTLTNTSMYKTVLPNYANALPSWLKTRLKPFSIKVSPDGSNATPITLTNQKLALRAEWEVFGAKSNAVAGQAEASGNKQVAYYATQSNRVKKKGHSGSAYYWWLRSPGGNPQNAGEIGSKGYLSFNGGLVTTTERAIRPLIQVKVK